MGDYHYKPLTDFSELNFPIDGMKRTAFPASFGTGNIANQGADKLFIALQTTFDNAANKITKRIPNPALKNTPFKLLDEPIVLGNGDIIDGFSTTVHGIDGRIDEPTEPATRLGTFELTWNAFLGTRNNISNPDAKPFSGDWSGFIREWREYAGIDLEDPFAGENTTTETQADIGEFGVFLKTFKDAVLAHGNPFLLDDWALLNPEIASDDTARDEFFKQQFLGAFSSFLEKFPYDGFSQQASGMPPTAASVAFLSEWSNFLAVTAVITDPVAAAAGDVKYWPSYESLYKAYVSSDPDEFKAAFQTFVLKQLSSRTAGSNFNPSQDIDEWAEQLVVQSQAATNATTSPDERKRQGLILIIFDILLLILNSLQDTIGVQANRLNFLTQWQVRYTEQAGRVHLYSSSEAVLSGPKDLWASTLGPSRAQTFTSTGNPADPATLYPDSAVVRRDLTIDTEFQSAVAFDDSDTSLEANLWRTRLNSSYYNKKGFAGISLKEIDTAFANNQDPLATGGGFYASLTSAETGSDPDRQYYVMTGTAGTYLDRSTVYKTNTNSEYERNQNGIYNGDVGIVDVRYQHYLKPGAQPMDIFNYTKQPNNMSEWTDPLPDGTDLNETDSDNWIDRKVKLDIKTSGGGIPKTFLNPSLVDSNDDQFKAAFPHEFTFGATGETTPFPGVWWFAEQPYADSDFERWGEPNIESLNSKIVAINTKRQQWIEAAKTRRGIIKDEAKQVETQLSGTKEAINQQANFLSSIIQSLQGLLQSIFR
jgi:hypothetical protein